MYHLKLMMDFNILDKVQSKPTLQISEQIMNAFQNTIFVFFLDHILEHLLEHILKYLLEQLIMCSFLKHFPRCIFKHITEHYFLHKTFRTLFGIQSGTITFETACGVLKWLMIGQEIILSIWYGRWQSIKVSNSFISQKFMSQIHS